MSKILTVLGATGVQGGSVVTAALKSNLYKVRAITRNVNSDAAKALSAQGVDVVAANLDDEESLVKAFEVYPRLFSRLKIFSCAHENRDLTQSLPLPISLPLLQPTVPRRLSRSRPPRASMPPKPHPRPPR